MRTNNGGTETVSVYTVTANAVTKTFFRSDTFYRYDYTAQTNTNEALIMAPIAVGTSWTLPSGAERAITALDAQITVPFGEYTALEVTTDYTDGVGKDYYAPGIGLIKRDFEPNAAPNDIIKSELIVYQQAAPLVQTIRTYYPDFNNEQIVITDQSVPLNTNDTIEDAIETLFKNVPPDSTLTPMMASDATINAITYSENTGVVTIDVSASFITEMTAGAYLEGMILESIGDTLGVYFMTPTVQITVDGDLYMSGHFGFGPNDYLPYDPPAAVEYTP